MKQKTKYAAGMRDELWGWLAAREGVASCTGGGEWFHGWSSCGRQKRGTKLWEGMCAVISRSEEVGNIHIYIPER